MTRHPLRTVLKHVFWRELAFAAQKPSQWLQPLVFFLLVITLFPLALSPDPGVLRTLAPGMVWVAALLSATLSLEGLFRADYDEGVLEQWALSDHPLWALLAVKILVHWLFTGLTLVVLSPLAALSLAVPASAWPVLMVSLALGSLSLSMLGAVGAALTLSARRSATLLSVLMMPLALPMLIFGARAMDLAILNEDPSGALWLLSSFCVLSVTLSLPTVAASIRIALE